MLPRSPPYILIILYFKNSLYIVSHLHFTFYLLRSTMSTSTYDTFILSPLTCVPRSPLSHFTEIFFTAYFSAPQMETTPFSKISGRIYQSTRRHTPEDSYILIHNCENVGYQRLHYCVSVPAGNREELTNRKFKVTEGHGYCVELLFCNFISFKVNGDEIGEICIPYYNIQILTVWRPPPRARNLEFPYSVQVKHEHKFRNTGL